jgi:hypothetical protein
MYLDDFPWRVDIDWPEKGPGHVGRVNTRSMEICDWLSETFGDSNWTIVGDAGMANLSAEEYQIRLRDEHSASLTVLRWA